MIVKEMHIEARKHGYTSLVLLIDYLVNERKVLKMTSNSAELTYYLQDKFAKKMNEYLADYKER